MARDERIRVPIPPEIEIPGEIRDAVLELHHDGFSTGYIRGYRKAADELSPQLEASRQRTTEAQMRLVEILRGLAETHPEVLPDMPLDVLSGSMQKPVSFLGLLRRVSETAGIDTVGQLSETHDETLLSIEGVGSRTLEAINYSMSQLGIERSVQQVPSIVPSVD
jgi:DNA-directed RNA polymerase alpha subunit